MASYNKNIAENSSTPPPARRPGRPRKNIIENKNIAEKSSIVPLARRPGRPRKNIIEHLSKNSDNAPVTPNTSTKHPVIRSSKNIVSENSDDVPITPNTPTKCSFTKNSDDISTTPNISAKCPVTRNSNILAGHSVKNINVSSNNTSSNTSTQLSHDHATHVTSHNYARLDYDTQLDQFDRVSQLDSDMSQYDYTNYIDCDTQLDTANEYENNSDCDSLTPLNSNESKKSGMEKLNI